MTTAPTPALVDAVDSFYELIKANVQSLNPARQFRGMVDAKDWPPKEITPEAPYLIVLRDLPTRTKHQSFYAPLLSETVEWRWVVQGPNIAADAQESNRGQKYRINVLMMQEMLSAHNPGYSLKKQFSVTNDVNNNPILVATPYNPPEPFWWTIPSFVRKQDRDSGMLYTAGQVDVSNFAPVSMNLG